MTTHSFSERGRSFARAALVFLLAGWVSLFASPAHAANRDWTGSASAFWSNPNNWNPVGVPQNGDALFFLDNSTPIMVNDVSGLTVERLIFSNNSFELGGNALTISPANPNSSGSAIMVGLGNYRTIRINCDLNLPVGGQILAGGSGDDILTFDSTIYLYLTGRLVLSSRNHVHLLADSMAFVNGFGDRFVNHGSIHVQGEITGTGALRVTCQEESFVEFSGAQANTFNGPMSIFTYDGGNSVSFNKVSGPVVNTSLFLSDGVIVRYGQDNQVGDNAIVSLQGGAKLLLQGHSDTVGSLVMTNFHADADPTLVDTRNGGATPGMLTLNGGITSWVFNDVVTPTIQGIVSLSLGDHAFNMMAPFAYAAFDMPAEMRGQGGFTKTGSGALFLPVSNSFNGLVVVSEGFVDARHVRAFGAGSFGVQLNGGGMILHALSIGTEALTVTGAGSLIETYGNCVWSGAITLNQQLSINSETLFQLPGVITGSGGLSLAGNTVELSGTLPNSFTGPTRADGALLYLNKSPSGTIYALSGPLIIGQNTAAPAEVRWLGASQINSSTTAVALYPTALMNLFGSGDSIGSLTFNGGTVTNSGIATLFVSQSVTANVASATANIDGGRLGLVTGNHPFNIADGPLEPDLAISAVVTGGGGITKIGLGALRLSGANTYLGQTDINAGLLHIQNNTGLGDVSGVTTVADGATLQTEFVSALAEPLTLSGTGRGGTNGALHLLAGSGGNFPVYLLASASVRVDSGSSIMSGVIAGPGSFTKIGAGTLQFGGGAGSANIFLGDTLVNEGTLVLFKPPFVQAVPGNLFVGPTNNALFPPATMVRYFNHDQVWGNLTVNRGGVLDLFGFDEYCGDVRLNGGGDVQTGAGTLYLAADGVNLIVDAGEFAGQSVVSGRLGLFPGMHRFSVSQRTAIGGPELEIPASIVQSSPTATVIKDGFGTMRWGASNNIGGTITIDAGQLIISNSVALGSKTAGTFVNNGGSLALEGGIYVQEETLTLNSTNPAAWVALGNSSNTWVAPVNLQRSAGIHVADAGGVLNIMSFFDCCGASYISGPGGLTKTGPGKLLLAGFSESAYDGPTTVTGGTLEAARFNGGSIRGNVSVDGAGATLTTFRLNAFAYPQLSATGTVTVRNGGLWNTGPTNGETVRGLFGDGTVNVSAGSYPTVNVSGTNEFPGVFAGSGQVLKSGAGRMVLRGTSPSFTGLMTVSGGDLVVHGSIPGGAVTVNSGSLRGSGTVGATTITIGATLAPELSQPSHFGAVLSMASLNLLPGTTTRLDLNGIGPNISGQRLLVLSNTAALGGTLVSGFRTAPHEGDVITLIQKDSAGLPTGAFAGLPEGAVTTVSNIPCRVSYQGGDGNDVTLTITNLALALVGFSISSGNGNQTLEADECVQLSVTLTNKRGVPLTLTNVLLRSILNSPVLPTVMESFYPTIPAGGIVSNLPLFQIRTATNFACGAQIPMEMQVTVPGEGTFAFNFNIPGSTNCSVPSGGLCESCYTVASLFTSNAPVAPLLQYSPVPSACVVPGYCPGAQTNTNFLIAGRYVAHRFTNTTARDLCITATVRADCASPSSPYGVAAYLGSFNTNDVCASYLGDASTAPRPFSFSVPAGTNFVVVIALRTTNIVCDAYTLELFGLPCPPPALRIAKDAAPDKVVLQWSSAYPDFRLQSANSLNGPGPSGFGNVATLPVVSGRKFAVTNSATAPRQFFQLVK